MLFVFNFFKFYSNHSLFPNIYHSFQNGNACYYLSFSYQYFVYLSNFSYSTTLYYKVLCHIKAPLFISFLKGNNVLGVLNFVYIISCFTSLKISKKHDFECFCNSLVMNQLQGQILKGAYLAFKRALVRPQKGIFCKSIGR